LELVHDLTNTSGRGIRLLHSLGGILLGGIPTGQRLCCQTSRSDGLFHTLASENKLGIHAA
jgi:hypothetical protein